jgi:hypothetical protein
MAGVTSGAGTDYPSRAHEFIPGFSGIRVTRSLLLCVMFCRSLFFLLSFFFWPLCRLFFFDIRIVITPLVSSNSSWQTQFWCLIIVNYTRILINISDVQFWYNYLQHLELKVKALTCIAHMQTNAKIHSQCSTYGKYIYNMYRHGS